MATHGNSPTTLEPLRIHKHSVRSCRISSCSCSPGPYEHSHRQLSPITSYVRARHPLQQAHRTRASSRNGAPTYFLSSGPAPTMYNLRNSVLPTAIGRSIQSVSLSMDISICTSPTSLPGEPLLTSATIFVPTDSSTLEFLCNHQQAGPPLTFPGSLFAMTHYSCTCAPHSKSVPALSLPDPVLI
ncbi:hypothetical protein KP509_09G097700 [Ceratopteris richardii]|uniref:Uncharacterized protein n=1 Tax=Ceratopteris richardii TaxID=49495 RepID=A0A8T2U783_CERRI|nr:hypothetical protein KP509_09G097700 [Ceratopteris richardii]